VLEGTREGGEREGKTHEKKAVASIHVALEHRERLELLLGRQRGQNQRVRVGAKRMGGGGCLFQVVVGEGILTSPSYSSFTSPSSSMPM
jgi:hypothetical protein